MEASTTISLSHSLLRLLFHSQWPRGRSEAIWLGVSWRGEAVAIEIASAPWGSHQLRRMASRTSPLAKTRKEAPVERIGPDEKPTP